MMSEIKKRRIAGSIIIGCGVLLIVLLPTLLSVLFTGMALSGGAGFLVDNKPQS